jgi:hypothetical protein
LTISVLLIIINKMKCSPTGKAGQLSSGISAPRPRVCSEG